MKVFLAAVLRHLACLVDGHRPVSLDEVTHCGSCGTALVSAEGLRRRVDEVFDLAWRRVKLGRAVRWPS